MSKLFDLGLMVLKVYDDGQAHILRPECTSSDGFSMYAASIGFTESSAIALRDALNVAFPVGDSVHITIQPAEEKSAATAPIADNLQWSNTLLDGKTVDYEAALAAVEALGEGWRLPTRFELEPLLDLSRHDPAIDTEKFPDTKSARYWTSSTCTWNDAAVWVVDFYDGNVFFNHRYDDACVRAVRP